MNEQLQNFQRLIEVSNNILLVSHKKIDGDGLSSVLIFHEYLKKKGKTSQILSSDPLAEVYNFLPGLDAVKIGGGDSQDVLMTVPFEGEGVPKVETRIANNTLQIMLHAGGVILKKEDIKTEDFLGTYDLIIVFDSGDLEHLGDIYEKNTNIFYDAPVVNIDHHISNVGFGKLNFVDVTAASTTQVLYSLLQDLEGEAFKDFLTEDMATLFLTGLIVDTGSFQHTNTSPKALELAADLIEAGARQQEIIQSIYKTKKLSTLKLWGKVLSRIEEDPVHKIVWSTISKSDLQETGSTIDEAEGVVDDLLTNAPGAEIVLLIKESLDDKIYVSMRATSPSVNILPIAQHFGGGGHSQAAGFSQKGHNFHLFVAKVIEFIEKYQTERLQLSDEMKESIRSDHKQAIEERQEVVEQEVEALEGESMDILAEITAPPHISEPTPEPAPIVEESNTVGAQQLVPEPEPIVEEPTPEPEPAPAVTKKQAAEYAEYYIKQMSTMDPATPEYAKIYQYYEYYNNMTK
ncbi:hypothetical protein COB57_06040 [Candidatus Peregrinibacteria bacterium]|nr:MAG: hypothetical protein COB57_06040 [Candidatus Peregrinibacteria bacterium]